MLQLNPGLQWRHRTSWSGPCSTWIFDCMSGGIVKELVMMYPSFLCLQSLRAPAVAVAEARVFSPSGAELEVMHQSMGKAQ